jgi:FMN reductase
MPEPDTIPRSPSLLAVLGSVTPPGRLRHALAGALDRATAAGIAQTTLIDLADVRIAFADGRPAADLGDDTAEVVQAIADADAVLFATPVYRGSLTGALKNLLDHVPVVALDGTPTAIAAMGATPHHFLGADRHLRDLLAFFGAAVSPVSTYLTARDFAEGVPTPEAAAQLDAQLAGLVTFAHALRRAGGPLGPPPFARPSA